MQTKREKTGALGAPPAKDIDCFTTDLYAEKIELIFDMLSLKSDVFEQKMESF